MGLRSCHFLRSWLFLTAAAFHFGTAAEPGIAVPGRIVDENNAPVPLASIEISEGSGDFRLLIRTVSSPAGTFELHLPRPGKYLVSASHDGFFSLKNSPLEISEGPGAS